MKQLRSQMSHYLWSHNKLHGLQFKHIFSFHLKSIAVVYRAKNVRTLSMNQYLWTRLLISE